MSNNSKCFRIFLLATLIIAFAFSLTGCWDDFFSDGDDSSQTVKLTMDNYAYYLSIDTVLIDSGSAAYIRYWSYKVTITGAVSGLYQNCKLRYKIGDEEYEVKLNAAGFGSFSYVISTNGGSFKFSGVEGQIVLQ